MPNQTRDLEPMREVFKTLLRDRNVNPDTALSELENGFLIKTTTPQSSIVCAVYRGSETKAVYLNVEVAFARGSTFELIKLKALIEESLGSMPMPFRPIIDSKYLALQIRTSACWITDQMLTEAIDCMLHSSGEYMSAALDRGLLVSSFFPDEPNPNAKAGIAEPRTLN